MTQAVALAAIALSLLLFGVALLAVSLYVSFRKPAAPIVRSVTPAKHVGPQSRQR